jgi:hypothetical protein
MCVVQHSRLVGLLSFFVLACLVVQPMAMAAGKKKGGKGKKPIKISTSGLKEDVGRAQAGLAHAVDRGVAAQSRLGYSYSRAQNARSAVEGARMDAENATEELKRIETEIVRAQDLDSKYADALKDWKEAERRYHEIRAGLYKSPEYLAKYRAAASSSNRAALLPKIRKEAEENNPDYKKAAMQMTIQKQTYEQVRMALFQEDADWVAASKAALEARRRQAQAQEHYKSAMVSKGITASNLSKATRDAVGAQMAIKKGQSAIKSVEAYNKKVDQQRKKSNQSSRRRR